MSTATIYASHAGYIIKYAVDTYANVHDAVNGTIAANDVSWYAGQQYSTSGGGTYYIYRGGIEFDLTTLSPSAIISAATLSLYGGIDHSDTDFDVTIVSGADLATILVVADYGDLLNDTTSFGTFNTSTFTTVDYNDITLNATGISALQTALSSNVIRFGVRSSRDIDGTTPKLNGATALEYVVFYALTTDKYPKLAITYASGELAGQYAVVETRWHYFGTDGAEYFIQGTAV